MEEKKFKVRIMGKTKIITQQEIDEWEEMGFVVEKITELKK